MLSPVCEISPDSTSSKSELLDTVYVASARMHTIVSFIPFPMHAVYSGSLFTFVAKAYLACSYSVSSAVIQWVDRASFPLTKLAGISGCSFAKCISDNKYVLDD